MVALALFLGVWHVLATRTGLRRAP
jgi:hypothetical protein